jgi:AraC family L-rhamnose operon transcriptional activator RhaR/AraC family L-rhamnose operon regulatory protein RhaS
MNAMAFIQHNFAERLSREQIAHAAGVSESYLTQLFQHELGVTPWVFLTRYRIANACQRIRTSAESITDIALAVGFDDPGYFSKVFRNEIGMTPREYRNQHV